MRPYNYYYCNKTYRFGEQLKCQTFINSTHLCCKVDRAGQFKAVAEMHTNEPFQNSILGQEKSTQGRFNTSL